jgi:phosphomannomutase
MLKEIFRAYDIRGIYGTQLTEKIARGVGNVVHNFVDGSIVLGRDNRISSPAVHKAFLEGALEAGLKVTDVGVVPNGVASFAGWVAQKPIAYITASHLDPEWNGIKLFHENGVGFSEEENSRIGELVLKEKFVRRQGGGVTALDMIDEYKKYLISKIVKIKSARKLDVVLDCGNGTAGLVSPSLFAEAGFDVRTINEGPDGKFPNRKPDIKPEVLSEIKKEARSADLGIAYDGDADRMVLVDDLGRILEPEQTAALILKGLGEGQVVANVECSRSIDSVAHAVHRIQVGHSYLVKYSLQRGAMLGFERSGHFIIPSLIPRDDAIAVSLFAASVLATQDKKLSEIVNTIPTYPCKRVNFSCPDKIKFDVIARITSRLKRKYKVNDLDGVRIDMPAGWALIRASNTSPNIRLTCEANTEQEMQKLLQKFGTIIQEEIERKR